MKTDSAQNDLLTRGGRPTLRDLLDRLEFNPAKGSITLNGERMLLTRASFGGDLRDQLVRRYSEHEAMVLMLRLGFRSGREDAEFIRQSWPALDPGDAFTAGTRLHMVTGSVKVETLSNDFDFDNDRFSGDFLWHESVEAAAYHRRHGRATRPVCWLQTGYAAGYASVFFRKLVIYKETSCSAMGHKSCRVVGKTVDGWGRDDPFVRMFLEEVLGNSVEPHRGPAQPQRPTPVRDLDALIVAPVMPRLQVLARSGTPALITGPSGAGLRAAARWLSRQRMAEGSFAILHAQAPELGERLSALALPAGAQRPTVPVLAISAIETLSPDRQWMLLELMTTERARAPQIIALSGVEAMALHALPGFLPELAHALSVLPIHMPALSARPEDIPALAAALLPGTATAEGQISPTLSAATQTFLSGLALPGNIPQLRTLIHRAALLAEAPGMIDVEDLRRAAEMEAPPPAGVDGTPWDMLAPAFVSGAMTLDALNAGLVRAALHHADGNVAAAARLMGLTRPQMAYRLAQSEKSDGTR
ncbi:XylR N-terminal domain-containing protein [Pararhodobacter sp. CCB-MM2]|uniref:XylR N-terminal domain-containing protein n=1 Tax=Pararhodobacter sp. CCB-MM2 TaxID=1786003 RepID=UPI0008344BE1|nr:XylR N-terminal domain-containing protein [Pararhodobacter sp. CCB-MM2]